MASADDKNILLKPLETNPEVVNEYLLNLGVDINYAVSEIYGFTPELLDFVTRPVYAVIFLYPIDAEGIQEDLSLLQEPEEERKRKDEELSEDMYLIKQTIRNACGTIALIHAIANNLPTIELKENSILKNFIDSTIDKTPDERGKLLEEDEQITIAHQDCAGNCETELPEHINLHFVALVEHRGYLWKCDGRTEEKAMRVNITSKNTIMESAAEYCIKFMEKNPKVLKFAALALQKL